MFREHYSFNSFPLDSKEVARFARLTLHSGRRGWGEESVSLLFLADSVLNTALTAIFSHMPHVVNNVLPTWKQKSSQMVLGLESRGLLSLNSLQPVSLAINPSHSAAPVALKAWVSLGQRRFDSLSGWCVCSRRPSKACMNFRLRGDSFA